MKIKSIGHHIKQRIRFFYWLFMIWCALCIIGLVAIFSTDKSTELLFDMFKTFHEKLKPYMKVSSYLKEIK